MRIGDGGSAEVRGRVDAVQLRGLEEGVEGGGDLGASSRFRAVVILAPDDGPADSSLGRIVVQRDARVAEEPRVPVPVGDDARASIADRQGLERRLGPEAGLHRGDDLRSLAAPKLRLRVDVSLVTIVDLVELPDP